jgi:hypothetical protein
MDAVQLREDIGYLIMPGGKVPIPPWYKGRSNPSKSMSMPGKRASRINSPSPPAAPEFDPPV